jgi:6-phosphofructokinase 1
MGRNAGHLALGIGKAAGATITLIPEEFKGKHVSVKKVADILAGAIIKRLHMGKDHGVAILAEGISEKFDVEELSHYESLEKDETGRIRLSEIQLGRVLKNFVKKTLDAMGINITIVDKNIGYELRAADPIPYDIEYTRNLGYGAMKFLLNGGTGSMIVFDEGRLRPISFVEMVDPSTGGMKISLVDVNAETYEVGRKYMIRLEGEDFEPKNAATLAKTAGMSVREFMSRFSYVAD